MISCDVCKSDSPLGKPGPVPPGVGWPVSVMPPAVTGVSPVHVCWPCLDALLHHLFTGDFNEPLQTRMPKFEGTK